VKATLKNQKGFTTMMTYTTAIENAIRALSASNENDETIERLQALSASLVKRNAHKTSDAVKEKQAAKRAEARTAVVNVVAPILREALTHTQIGVTAKELYDLAKANLPEDFTANKVQYILLHEMASEVEKIEAKGKPNTYRRA